MPFDSRYTGGSFGPGNPSTMGSATRIYRNANGVVIAIDDIKIVGHPVRVPEMNPPTVNKFFSRCHRETKRTLLHRTGESRIVNEVQMIGDYTSVTVAGGDYTHATWTLEAGGQYQFNFADLGVVGDTIS